MAAAALLSAPSTFWRISWQNCSRCPTSPDGAFWYTFGTMLHPARAPAERFVENLKKVRKVLGLSLKELAADCGFKADGYKWLRRAATQGVSRRQRNNQDRTDVLAAAIADRFVPRVKLKGAQRELTQLLWSNDMVEVLRSWEGRTETDDREAADRLISLLRTGKYEYLRAMVVDLHSRQFP